VQTVTHALLEAERFYGMSFDLALIIEPTSPLRVPADITAAVSILLETGVDSVIAVSRLDSKYHPRKVLDIQGDRLFFFDPDGSRVVARQSLQPLYWRNGVCYALTRSCLLEKQQIFTENSVPLVIEREIINIDEPIELEYAELLMRRGDYDVENS
jgi:CMP-N-acetylneuraminic acid synthetase